MSNLHLEENYLTLENFNPKNYEKKNSFFIVITRFKKFLKNISPQEDLVENNELPNLIIQKVKSLSHEIDNSKNNKSIIISDEYYKIFKSLEKVDKNESDYAKNILTIINNKKRRKNYTK